MASGCNTGALIGGKWGYLKAVGILNRRCGNQEMDIRPNPGSHATNEEWADWINAIWDHCMGKYDILRLEKRSPFTAAQFSELEPDRAPNDGNHLNFDTGALNKVTNAFRPCARAARAAGPAMQKLERKLAVEERFE
ncbi:MAG: hypothetical protein M1826_001214 [Phylliscum demangeonii]|nr:MAG: hypothetical protein M1826_001214 [Phylliscum demangeonii]